MAALGILRLHGEIDIDAAYAQESARDKSGNSRPMHRRVPDPGFNAAK
jgi:hypothetical protein